MKTNASALSPTDPLSSDAISRMPGHWLLARMGKRVLRPGGLELTRRLLDHLDIGGADTVVEFAPGLGVTAQLALARRPASYVGVERDEDAAARLRLLLDGPGRLVFARPAEATGLPGASANVVYGEAMLTMQGPERKVQIVNEAFRLLRSGGRYGIHELCLKPDDVGPQVKHDIERALSDSIHVGARPLTVPEWTALLESAGFRVRTVETAPMHLLKPLRLVQDEGWWRAVRFAINVLRTPAARRRVWAMRTVFRRYHRHLAAVMLVAERPADANRV